MEDSDRRLILEFMEEAMDVAGTDSLPSGVEKFSTMRVEEGLLIRLGDMPPYVISLLGPVKLVVDQPEKKQPQKPGKPSSEKKSSKKLVESKTSEPPEDKSAEVK